MEFRVVCYLKGCKMCKLCMDEYIYFVFGIITISTTRVDFVCLAEKFGVEYNIMYCQ